MDGERRLPCSRCGRKKEPRPGAKFCLSCSEERKEELKIQRKLSLRQPCKKCGEPKRPGHGKQYCQDCYDLQMWLREKKHNRRTVRMCAKCGKNQAVKHCTQCLECKNPVRQCVNCTNPARGKYKKLCESCHNAALEHEKVYQREWARKHPQKKRRAKAKWTAEQRLRYNEVRRINYRLKHNIKPVSEKAYLRGNGRQSRKAELSAAPLVPFMRGWLEQNPTHVKGLIVPSVLKLSKVSGVNDKRLRWILDGKMNTISMSDADKVCIAMDTTLDWVYDRKFSEDGNLCA